MQKSIEELQLLQSTLKTSIAEEIGKANCSTDMQCKVLAIGSNPCGGPESYQAYSTANTDITKLLQLAIQYSNTRKALHEKTGTVGMCVVIPKPEARCVAKHCVTTDKTDKTDKHDEITF